MTTGTQG